MIARLLQEELDAEEAKNLVNQQENENSYQDLDSDYNEYDDQSSNVRPPTDIYEDQMIGGGGSSNRPFTYTSNTVQFPGGFSRVQ